MKYCETCRQEFDTDALVCPICGGELKDIADEDSMIDTAAILTVLDII